MKQFTKLSGEQATFFFFWGGGGVIFNVQLELFLVTVELLCLHSVRCLLEATTLREKKLLQAKKLQL